MDANQPAKRVYTVKPNKECKQCHGSGEYIDREEDGIPLTALCDCVIDQLLPGTTSIKLDLSDFDPTYKLDVKEG